MAEPRTVVFEVGPLRIVGDAYGDPADRPVLLLHGGGQTRHAWGDTAAALADEGHHAVALDLRGHGDSSWDPEGDYGAEALAGSGELEVLPGAGHLLTEAADHLRDRLHRWIPDVLARPLCDVEASAPGG